MNREWHLVIGGIAFFLYQMFLDAFNTAIHYPWLLGIFLIAIGSVFPDTLEPGFSRYHRGFFHSHGALALMSIFFIVSAAITSFSSTFPNLVFIYLVSCFFLGYVFHLLADSTTTMGLPR